MSLYDRIAARPGGERDLAAGRLRYAALNVLHDAFAESGLTDAEFARAAGIRRRCAEKILHGNGDVTVSVLAECLHALGKEAEISLVPAGEPRRRAVGDVRPVVVEADDRPAACFDEHDLGVIASFETSGDQ